MCILHFLYFFVNIEFLIFLRFLRFSMFLQYFVLSAFIDPKYSKNEKDQDYKILVFSLFCVFLFF